MTNAITFADRRQCVNDAIFPCHGLKFIFVHRHVLSIKCLIITKTLFLSGQVSEVPLLLDALTNTIRESATVEVTFSGNAKKVVTEDVEVSTAHGFVFLQTDKPIYRVSETVRFRVLRLDRSLSPLNESVVLKIANHQRIKVEEVVLVTGPPMHIAEHKFNFPLIAKPGTWMAEVFYGPKVCLNVVYHLNNLTLFFPSINWWPALLLT